MRISTIAKINKLILFSAKVLNKCHLYFLTRIISFPRFYLTKNKICSLIPDSLSKKYDYSNLEEIKNFPVFVMWLQGKESMPEAIKLCFNSIKKNIQNHQIILITQDNINQFVDFPDYIYEKLDKGLITRTHFSDIVRAALLYKYGGMWIDATVFLTKPVTDEYLLQTFICPAGLQKEKKTEWKYFFKESNGWTGWCMGTKYKNFPFYDFLISSFLEYWKHESQLIDYFLIDFMVTIFYSYNGEFHQILNNLEINNPNPYDFCKFLNYRYTDNFQIAKLCNNNIVNKLTYKKTFYKEINGHETIYGHLCKEYDI